MSSRPYFQFGIQQLEQLAESSWNDAGCLRTIAAELQHRKRKTRNIQLRERLEARLDELSHQNTALLSTPTIQPPSASGSEQQANCNTDGTQLPREGLNQVTPASASPTRKVLKRITAPGQPGQPRRWQRRDSPTKDQPSFNATGDLAKDFAAVLEIYVQELKALDAGSTIGVHGGRFTGTAAGQYIYKFGLSEDVFLRDDTPIQILVGGNEVSATVISVSPSTLTIATEEDLGPVIEYAQIRTDQSFLTVKLKEAIDRVVADEQTFSRETAEKVLGRTEPSVGMATPEGRSALASLNEEQLSGLKRALGSEVLYLWGPPGTGKTKVVAQIVLELYQRGERILVVSNTNLAVDGLLYQVCLGMKETRDAGFERGSVIRSGVIQDRGLADEFGSNVDVSQVIARLSAELIEEKAVLQEKMDHILPQIEGCKAVLAAFAELESLGMQIEKVNADLRTSQHDHMSVSRELDAVPTKRIELQQALRSAENASTVRNFFAGRNPKHLQSQLSSLSEQELRLRQRLDELEQSQRRSEATQKQLTTRQQDLERRLAGKDLALERHKLQGHEAEVQPLRTRINAINEQLEQIEEEVYRNCRVLAATATQTYLKPNRFSGLDAVVIDEASMLTLPVAFYVGGLAGKRVIVAGDFRQLAPIVQTNYPVVEEWVGTDVFEFSGICKLVDSGARPEKLVRLRTQYRMREVICDIINETFYRGELKTGTKHKGHGPDPPYPYEGPLTLVDTSSEWPFASLRPGTYSRYNVLHALGIRSLCAKLVKEGFSRSPECLGVISPYSAQADFLKALLNEEGLSNVESGTVHRFQGNQKRMMIVDITDSPGVRHISQFLAANRPQDSGAKLFNVAFSRPQDHLVVFANLTHLEETLPTDSFLRAILYKIQEDGRVIEARDFLALSEKDLSVRGPGIVAAALEIDPTKTLFVDQTQFDPIFLSDLESAKESIAIFSGFCTDSRVGIWAPIFREKTSKGVKIRCVTRPARMQGNIPPDAVQRAIDSLVGIGVTVDLRGQIHEKIVIIDKKIAWYGSLNPLSHTGNTDELMGRQESVALCEKLAQMIATRTLAASESEAALNAIANRENPPCGGCGGLSVFSRGRYGPFFYCASKCGWKESLDGPRRRANQPLNLDEYEVPDQMKCPECGGEMKIRNGRYGPFWGCASYPRCHAKVKLNKKGARPAKRTSAQRNSTKSKSSR